MTNETRKQHPFFMYDAIYNQPEALARTICYNEQYANQFASRIISCERLFLVGTGTSYHAAKVGEYFLNLYCKELHIKAFQAFEFAHYGPNLSSRDCVIAISHRGNKLYTLNSLKYASTMGSLTALITGKGGTAEAIPTDFCFYTVLQEKSAAHTVSYVTAIAVLALITYSISYKQGSECLITRNFLQDHIPQKLDTALTTENDARLLAKKYHGCRRFWLVGGGPDAITAHEIALKIKETSYLQAEGMSIESMLHGPFLCSEADDLFILIAPSVVAKDRVIQLAKLVEEIGAKYCLICDTMLQLPPKENKYQITLPVLPEAFTTLTCLLPLQFFAYYLAIEHGTNPDGFRLDEPRFARARKLIQL
jgi:glucosamine--fructose-6-phosphate aminotransferase (isomerizing)